MKYWSVHNFACEQWHLWHKCIWETGWFWLQEESGAESVPLRNLITAARDNYVDPTTVTRVEHNCKWCTQCTLHTVHNCKWSCTVQGWQKQFLRYGGRVSSTSLRTFKSPFFYLFPLKTFMRRRRASQSLDNNKIKKWIKINSGITSSLLNKQLSSRIGIWLK